MKTYVILYRKNGDGVPDKTLVVGELWNPHKFAFVKAIEAENTGDAYCKMQGEIWSPHGEAREHIKSLGLDHTSMMLGDVIYDVEGKAYWQVDYIGYLPVPYGDEN